MTRTKISNLKAKLSAYVARARAGDSIVIMDRDTPVAKLVPWEDDQEPLILAPASSPSSSVRRKSPVRLLKRVDSLALLREDREDR